jgi:hypothetical protein
MVVVVQELSDRDMASLSTVAECVIGILPDDVIFMTDEARFHLAGCVNKQNFCYWTEENPQQLHQRPLHSARVTGSEWQTSDSKASYFFGRRN